MNPFHINPNPLPRQRHGFAVVIALTMMSLVLVIVLTLGVLVRVETAAASQTREMTMARESARLGLLTAVGQLQKSLGPDQRVSSSAQIFSSDPGVVHPQWVGVWDTNPSSALHSAANGQGKMDAALTWLVSTDPGSPVTPQSLPTSRIELVSPVGSAAAVEAPLVTMTSSSSGGRNTRYAYWVADENEKAKLNLSDPYAGGTVRESLLRYQTLPSAGVTAIDGWESFPRFSAIVGQIISMEQVELSAPAVPSSEFLHDLTLWSNGVLADVVHGGLKADLTHAFENTAVFNREFSGSNFQLIDDPDILTGGPNWGILNAFYHLPAQYQADGETIFAIGPGSAAVPFTTDVAGFPANFSESDKDVPYHDLNDLVQSSSVYQQNNPLLPVFGRFILGLLISMTLLEKQF